MTEPKKVLPGPPFRWGRLGLAFVLAVVSGATVMALVWVVTVVSLEVMAALLLGASLALAMAIIFSFLEREKSE